MSRLDICVSQLQDLLHHNMACILYQCQSIYVHTIDLAAEGTLARIEMVIELTYRCTWRS